MPLEVVHLSTKAERELQALYILGELNGWLVSVGRDSGGYGYFNERLRLFFVKPPALYKCLLVELKVLLLFLPVALRMRS